MSSDLPMILEIVDSVEKIDLILPELSKMVPKGLVYTVDIEVYKHVPDTRNS